MYSPFTMHTWWQAPMELGPFNTTFPWRNTPEPTDLPPIIQHTGRQSINDGGGGVTVQEQAAPYDIETTFPTWTAITARPQARGNQYNDLGNPGCLLGLGGPPIHTPTQKMSGIYPQQDFF